jgi:DNA repair photolyase
MKIVVRETETKDWLSKTTIPVADYVINPYGGCPHGCIYCYAEFMKRFAHRPEPWGEYLDVKHCERPISARKLRGMTVTLSSVTDAYNPYERKNEVTRGILKQLAAMGEDVSVEILTKGDGFVRDIDIMKSMPRLHLGISLNTLDDSVRKVTEPRAPSTAKRLEALHTAHDAGISTYVFMSPMLPGITDFKAIISASRGFSDKFTFENLNLRGSYRHRVLKYIADYHPHLSPLYDEIYVRRDGSYWKDLETEIEDYCTSEGLCWHSYFYHEKIRGTFRKDY